MGCGASAATTAETQGDPKPGGSSSSSATAPLQETDAPPDEMATESRCIPELDHPLSDAEREGAWRAANFFAATSKNAQPVALWILGPSSVGKSTLTEKVGTRFGIPEMALADQSRCTKLDAVLIDGEFMRNEHPLWKSMVQSEDWRSAYPLLKATINAEKDGLCAEAALQGKHLIIPHTCLNLEKSLAEMRELARAGYINHVFAVVAPLADCQRRGLARELATGKRYQPREYERSISAISPMVEAANGRFELVQAFEEDSKADESPTMQFKVLVLGDGGACSTAPVAKGGEANVDASAGPLEGAPGSTLDPGIKAKMCMAISEAIGKEQVVS